MTFNMKSLHPVLAILWSVICWQPLAGLTQEPLALSCAAWTVGQHNKPIDDHLACLNSQSSSGTLKNIQTPALYSETTFYYTNVANTGNKAAADIIKILVDERERRQPPKRPSSVPYSAFLLSGQVEKAMVERAEKKLDVPEIDVASIRSALPASSNESSYWSFAGRGNLLRKATVDLTHGSHIIVYSSPGCGVCYVLAEELLQQSRLAKAFRKSAIWIDTADGNFARENYELWESKFPQFPIHAIFDRKNWPERPLPATPYIYFIKDGKIEDQMLGWTAENKLRLDATLEQLGFIPPEQ